ncbi:MAG TPA: hypothetical protein VM143_01195 [Acidimicrobiales bacterium]|nr:hypothetical protein [Acidimicrobiales bacterium]
MIARLPERVRTRAVAEAVVSPSAILLAGAGTALGIATGLGPLALVAGAAAWAARVAFAVPRRPAGERIDPFQVGDPWRRFVLDAQQADRKFTTVVARARSGPIQERLQEIGRRIGDGVSECWRIAKQGDALDGAIRSLNEQEIYQELLEVQDERRRLRDNESAQSSLARTQTAIEAQLASGRRLRAVADDARNRLRLLNAQLDEAVARSLEISLQAGDVTQLGSLTQDVEGVVAELESLRQALEETSDTPEGQGATGTAP